MSYPDWWYDQIYYPDLWKYHLNGHNGDDVRCYYCDYDRRLNKWRREQRALHSPSTPAGTGR